MGSTILRSNRRKRGNIETLRSGAKRIRVCNGRAPVTKRPIYVGETIPADPPNRDKSAEQALTRWLKPVDGLIDAFLDIADIDRGTLRGVITAVCRTGAWACPHRRSERSTPF